MRSRPWRVFLMAQQIRESRPAPPQPNIQDVFLNYARREKPEVLRQTVEEKPWFMKAMGNPIVMGALAMAATKLVTNQRKRHGGGGGLL